MRGKVARRKEAVPQIDSSRSRGRPPGILAWINALHRVLSGREARKLLDSIKATTDHIGA